VGGRVAGQTLGGKCPKTETGTKRHTDERPEHTKARNGPWTTKRAKKMLGTKRIALSPPNGKKRKTCRRPEYQGEINEGECGLFWLGVPKSHLVRGTAKQTREGRKDRKAIKNPPTGGYDGGKDGIRQPQVPNAGIKLCPKKL